jgi:hypothetical protein
MSANAPSFARYIGMQMQVVEQEGRAFQFRIGSIAYSERLLGNPPFQTVVGIVDLSWDWIVRGSYTPRGWCWKPIPPSINGKPFELELEYLGDGILLPDHSTVFGSAMNGYVVILLPKGHKDAISDARIKKILGHSRG